MVAIVVVRAAADALSARLPVVSWQDCVDVTKSRILVPPRIITPLHVMLPHRPATPLVAMFLYLFHSQLLFPPLEIAGNVRHRPRLPPLEIMLSPYEIIVLLHGGR